MKVCIPKNIYAEILSNAIDYENVHTFETKPSSLLTKSLENDECDAALVPTFDLLKHKDLFVSKDVALSFDGFLSNAQIYFKPDQQDISNLYLKGDVSTNEIVLAKIIFEERFNTDINVSLATEDFKIEDKNHILVGDENLSEKRMNKSLSFSDQVAEFIDYPYVDYVLVAKDEAKLHELLNNVEQVDKLIESHIDAILENVHYSDMIKNTIKQNLNTLYFELTANEIDGLNELLRLPFYHGIVDEILEVKFV